MFYIMAYVEGDIFWNSALPEIASVATRGAMYDEMNRVLAALHSVAVSYTHLTLPTILLV